MNNNLQMNIELTKAIDTMVDKIINILKNNNPSIYLYGSVALNDFKLGWSDIDILVLTQDHISDEQALKLVDLRQIMLNEEGCNPYYRLFEGGMLTLSSFIRGTPCNVVYWGTSGQRITNYYTFDPFSLSELLNNGVLLYGSDISEQLKWPTKEEIVLAVKNHYETIRKYVKDTNGSLYSFGWLLDISRCIYTLRTGKIIPKTEAGEWALREGLCPCEEALRKALQIRKDPDKYKNDINIISYAKTLGGDIQSYADILERELILKMN